MLDLDLCFLNLFLPCKLHLCQEEKRLDNVIIAQEILHTISEKKGNEGYMTIKVDLKKVYDIME